MNKYVGNKMMSDELAINYLKAGLAPQFMIIFILLVDPKYYVVFLIYILALTIIWIFLKCMSARVLKYNLLIIYCLTTIIPYTILLLLISSLIENLFFAILFILINALICYTRYKSDSLIYEKKTNNYKYSGIAIFIAAIVSLNFHPNFMEIILVYLLFIFISSWAIYSMLFKYIKFEISRN